MQQKLWSLIVKRFHAATVQRSMCLFHQAITVLLLLAVSPLSAYAKTPTSSSIGVDAGTHIGKIWRADVHEKTGVVATSSDDKTVRLWSLDNGELLNSFRFPTADARNGKLYAIDIHPEGKLIAVSGRPPAQDQNTPIYIVNSGTGQLVNRICCLAGVVYHLEFSPDGKRLAVVISSTDSGGSALRIYNADNGWQELVHHDFPKARYSLWLNHSRDGRLAVSSFDGKVRLYDTEGKALAVAESLSGKQPVAIAFNPANDVLAVGYTDRPVVDLLDGTTLKKAKTIEVTDLAGGSLSKVAWSPEGEVLYAGANGSDNEGVRFFAWDKQGYGARSDSSWGVTIASALVPLKNGDVFIATQEPTLRRLDGIEKLRWEVEPASLNIARRADAFRLSPDGNTIQLDTDSDGARYFDVENLVYSKGLRASTIPPRLTGLDVTDWEGGTEPKFNGVALEMEPLERSLSLAIDAKAERFALGTDWALRFYAASGDPLWRVGIEAGAHHVNISHDGSKVAAVLYDGTIRWYDSRDGTELLSLFPHQDIDGWVAWTADGYIAASGDELVSAYELRQGDLDELPELTLIDNDSDRYQPDEVAGALGK